MAYPSYTLHPNLTSGDKSPFPPRFDGVTANSVNNPFSYNLSQLKGPTMEAAAAAGGLGSILGAFSGPISSLINANSQQKIAGVQDATNRKALEQQLKQFQDSLLFHQDQFGWQKDMYNQQRDIASKNFSNMLGQGTNPYTGRSMYMMNRGSGASGLGIPFGSNSNPFQ